jgi:hypothetical protein
MNKQDSLVGRLYSRINYVKKVNIEENENEIDEIFSKPRDSECVELANKRWEVLVQWESVVLNSIEKLNDRVKPV